MTYHRTLAAVNDRPGLIFMASCFVITAIGVNWARLYARRLMKTYLGADDWLSFVSMAFVLGLNATFIAGTVQGAITGHSPVVDDAPVDTPLQHVVEKYKYAFQIIEKPAFALIKISILLLLHRLFKPSKKFSMGCWIMIGVVAAWGTAFFFATVFQCGTNWWLDSADIYMFLSECTNTLDMLTVFTATDVVTDLIIIAMPVPMIWRLHMPVRRKIGVSSIFMVGLFTVGAGIARMYIYLVTSYDMEDNPDFIADFSLFILWSEIEINVAMIVCCMPTLVPVVAKLRDGMKAGVQQVSQRYLASTPRFHPFSKSFESSPDASKEREGKQGVVSKYAT